VGNDVVLVLILVLIIVVVWRGPRTLPELGRMFGRGVREARAEASKLRAGDEPASSAGSADAPGSTDSTPGSTSA
jgi:Sec-independent protein translocase protein TatA